MLCFRCNDIGYCQLVKDSRSVVGLWRLQCSFLPCMPCVPPVVCCDPCRSSGEVLDSGYGTLTFEKPDVANFRDNTVSTTLVNPVRLLTIQLSPVSNYEYHTTPAIQLCSCFPHKDNKTHYKLVPARCIIFYLRALEQ